MTNDAPSSHPIPDPSSPPRRPDLLHEGLLLVILLLAGYLRFSGLNWDAYTHLHPDERFLTMVESSIRLPASIGEYFNTASSPLNPHNAGHGYFVYGTLPIFLVRLIGEWAGRTGYDEIHLVGRAASAAFDVLSVLLVYLIGTRLWRRRVGLVAAALAAFSVLMIQHAHFFVVDTFANTFILLGIYFTVRVQFEGRLWQFMAFGAALGMAVASKLNAVALAAVVVLAAVAYWLDLPEERREREGTRLVGGVAAAALVSLVVFRVFQPYSFAGPGFFGIRLNPLWLDNMRSLYEQGQGNVDFPPALQWANRPLFLFAFKNMVLWGLGLPLGIAAWLAWGAGVVRVLRGEWRRLLLLVAWTGVYFVWQASSFTPTMRYLLPIYPTLAILAAWGGWEVWWAASAAPPRWRGAARLGAGALLAGVVGATAVYAFAFRTIYVTPVTRVAASEWIFENLPAAANLVVETQDGEVLEPIPLAYDFTLRPDHPFQTSFTSGGATQANALRFNYITDLAPELAGRSLRAEVFAESDPAAILGQGRFTGVVPPGETHIVLPLDQGMPLQPETRYLLRILTDLPGAYMLRGTVDVLGEAGGIVDSLTPPNEEFAVGVGTPRDVLVTGHADGTATALVLPYVHGLPGPAGVERELLITIYADDPDGRREIGRAVFRGDVPESGEQELRVPLEAPIPIEAGRRYAVEFTPQRGGGYALRGAVIISESTWDDGLPVHVAGREYGSVYRGVVMELYWQDDQDDDLDGVPDKIDRIATTMTEGDILAITSNRQYGTIPRVPQRYPLTTAFYRELLGCPEAQSILHCYATARPGQYQGRLGYDLVAVFESPPRLGPLEFPDQLAEEAFTVYDHPKVLIFAKTEAYSEAVVRTTLGAVDLSTVVHVTPKEAGSPPPTLMLPQERLGEQQRGGTWSDLYPADSPLNRFPWLGAGAWYLLITLFGLAAFPLARRAFSGLPDQGYPLARGLGLVLVAWGSWMLSSARVPFGRASLLAVFGAMLAASLVLAWRDRAELRVYVREHWREIVWIEILALSLFLIDLGIRAANPDLWHPSKGGEKPMDFSYLNAVLKSTSFPPYDPWFAGGYINYYYYGFVLVAAPIRLLGIVPNVAYNIALPMMFSLLGLSACSIGFNLVRRSEAERRGGWWSHAHTAGLAAALALVLLGNLGTAQLMYTGMKQIGTEGGEAVRSFLPGMWQAARGFVRYITFDRDLPIALDQWYWDPSRAIPPAEGEAGPITEFPFFTFLYADLHAHLLSRLLTAMTVAWGIALLFSLQWGRRPPWPDRLLRFFVGGLIVGAIPLTNLADYPPYWFLAFLVAAAAPILRDWPDLRGVRLASRAWGLTLLESVLSAAAILLLARLLYAPYHAWYGEGYGSVELWRGGKTSLGAYFVVHGLFLAALVSWMAWETREWMAATPVSALGRLRRWTTPILGSALVAVVALLALAAYGVSVILLIGPLGIWAAILLLRPGLALEKRIVLVLAALALGLTLIVELVVVVGDISRMNTVFKFYLQAWELFAFTASAAMAWTIRALPAWSPGWRRAWQVLLGMLVFCAALYPLTATLAKVRDRMAEEAPRTLDGTAFMAAATYYDIGGGYSLNRDYQAIRWMQQNIKGSPVILEANVPEYRWGSRFTIYTGLPGVLGWNWHQRQQRLVTGDVPVTTRALGITDFYLTRSLDEAEQFLAEYNVSYVIVGTLERMYYETMQPCAVLAETGGVLCDMSGRPMGMPQPEVAAAECRPIDPNTPEGPMVCPTHGLEKFPEMMRDGRLRLVYDEEDTQIYEVVR
jgi:YYY domain-containing protein